MGGALVVLLSLFLIWPIIWLVRVISGRRAAPRPAPARLASLAAVLVALLGLVLIVGLAAALFSNGLDGLVVLYLGFPRAALPALVLAPVVGLLAVWMLVGSGLAWARGYWSAGERVYFSLLTLAALAFTAGLAATGLLTALVR